MKSRTSGAWGAAALLLAAAVFLVPARLEAQALAGLERPRHVATRSFDIYFPAQRTPEALRLASFADAVLDDLTSVFGATLPAKRFPVLISDVSPYLNGYFTVYPSNRIVLFPAAAKPGDSLAGMDDELRSVFLHELVHAITLNAKSPFWKFLSGLTGDILAPSAWIVPNAFVEGSAVWAESRTWSPDAPRSGRLNDPAALEPVYLGLSRGEAPGLWDISGIEDYPGSGALPYLYGGLFVEFLAERLGETSIQALWTEAGKGNIFSGFEKILAAESGMAMDALWDEFSGWLLSRGAKGVREPGLETTALDLGSKRFGAFTLYDGTLYYLDNEKSAVFSRRLGSGQDEPSLRLFPADAALERIYFPEEGHRLMLEWLKAAEGGVLTPATYAFDLETGTMSFEGFRTKAEPGEAASSANSGTPPFLYDAQRAPGSDWTYGLVRIGPAVLPARRDMAGSLEVLEAGTLVFRSISLDRSEYGGETGTRLALQVFGDDTISRLALLEEREGQWILRVARSPLAGGASSPSLDGTLIVARADSGGGVQTLNLIGIDKDAEDRFFDARQTAWVGIPEWRARHVTAALPGADTEPEASSIPISKAPRFPLAGATSQRPFFDDDTLGISVVGADLTERLEWALSAGWDFGAKAPEFSAAVEISAGWSSFTLAASDSAEALADGEGAARVSSLFFRQYRIIPLHPLTRILFFSTSGFMAGIDMEYSIQELFSPAYGYQSWGGSAGIGYSSMRSQLFPPRDPVGVSFRAGAEYETLPGEAQGFSLSALAAFSTRKPSVSLNIAGAVSLSDQLSFHPAGRRFQTGDTDRISAMSPAYPVFREYAGFTEASPWYLSAEVSARLASVSLTEVLRPLKIAFLPALVFRRLSLDGGMRGALLGMDAGLAYPSSVYLGADIDATLLAGLAAETTMSARAEIAYSLAQDLPGGGTIYIDFNFEAGL